MLLEVGKPTVPTGCWWAEAQFRPSGEVRLFLPFGFYEKKEYINISIKHGATIN